MTKPRHPLTVEFALDRIVDRLGVRAVARLARVAGRTVHDWTDPDSQRSPPIAVALTLDLAWRDAGGEGFPLFDTYRRLLDHAAPAPPINLLNQLCVVIREGSQAEEAVLLAIRPGATPQHNLTAAREVEESIVAFSAMLPTLLSAGTPS